VVGSCTVCAWSDPWRSPWAGSAGRVSSCSTRPAPAATIAGAGDLLGQVLALLIDDDVCRYGAVVLIGLASCGVLVWVMQRWRLGRRSE
jgi:hypothetical protein